MTGNRKTLLTAGILLVSGGFFLGGWVAWSIFQPTPQKAPYVYTMVEEGGVEAFPDLGLAGEGGVDSPNLVIRKYELRVDQIDKPIAVFHTAARNKGEPVLLDWRNYLAEPVINAASDVSETAVLAEAIREHAPEGAPVIGWWDISRRLKLLAGIDVLFDRHLAQPVLLPESWNRYQKPIKAVERSFWNLNKGESGEVLFEQFTEALLTDRQAAAAEKLRALVGGRESFLVLSVQDTYKVGALYPERFGIGFKDFAKGEDAHGMASSIKKWLKEEGYENYTTQRLGKTVVRVYFLTDEASSRTLLAQALPFTNSRPMELTEIELVYQHGDFWVYRVPPAEQEAETETTPPAL